jgi:hypothetical protein
VPARIVVPRFDSDSRKLPLILLFALFSLISLISPISRAILSVPSHTHFSRTLLPVSLFSPTLIVRVARACVPIITTLIYLFHSIPNSFHWCCHHAPSRNHPTYSSSFSFTHYTRLHPLLVCPYFHLLSIILHTDTHIHTYLCVEFSLVCPRAPLKSLSSKNNSPEQFKDSVSSVPGHSTIEQTVFEQDFSSFALSVLEEFFPFLHVHVLDDTHKYLRARNGYLLALPSTDGCIPNHLD